jgi:hypothetical protein
MQEPNDFLTTLNLGVLGERTARIWYFYTPEQRGRYSGPPEDCYPDEPAEVDISRVEVAIDDEEKQWFDLIWAMIDSDTQDSLTTSIIEQEVCNAKEEKGEAEYRHYESRTEARDYTDYWP